MLLSKLKVIELDEVDSTNDYLKKNYLNYESLTVVRTNYQTNGRGQFDRTWQSNNYENLLMSFLIKDVSIYKIDLIKKTVVETLLLYLKDNDIKGIFKEPNDIYVDGKKILGILIETKTNSTKNIFDYIIIGIGLNLNQKEFNIDNASSLSLLSSKEYNIKEVMLNIISIFMKNYNQKMELIK